LWLLLRVDYLQFIPNKRMLDFYWGDGVAFVAQSLFPFWELYWNKSNSAPQIIRKFFMSLKKIYPTLRNIGMGIAYFICKQFARSFSKFSY